MKYAKDLINFIKDSPSVYHNIALIKQILNSFEFKELKENEAWNLEEEESYYVVRDASLIAFKCGKDVNKFNIALAHNDSPTFKLKPVFELNSQNYALINVEGYGGALKKTWMDRPLSIAGRAVVKTAEGLETRLVNLSAHTFIIPSVAIHFDREEAFPQKVQNDLLPLAGLNQNKVMELIRKQVCFEEGDEILSHDLFLYNKEEGCIGGAEGELIISPKLDDLACVFANLEALLGIAPKQAVNVCCVFNHEEVGSASRAGAGSTFLKDVLERICNGLEKDYHQMLAASFMVSADNAHAVHPAHPELSDSTSKIYLNCGVAVKHHANLAYTTDAISSAHFKDLAGKAKVSVQDYANNSNLRSGSTLGHILLSQVSVSCVDVGLPQLAMHSSMETCGASDLDQMVSIIKELYKE